jgi:hypothetical protein
LNDQELKVFKEQLDKDDLGEVMKLIEGTTTESLGEMQSDIDILLNENQEDEKKKKDDNDVNPFTSLFEFFSYSKKDKKKEKEDLSKGIRPDNKYEKTFRSQAIISAKGKCFGLFNVYKKTHGMYNVDGPFDGI